MNTNRLHRLVNEKVIGGVAAGMAYHFGIDRALMRVLFVMAFFFTQVAPVVIIYILLWALLPKAVKNTGNVELTQL